MASTLAIHVCAAAEASGLNRRVEIVLSDDTGKIQQRCVRLL